MPVIFPVLSTVAMLVLLLFHVRDLLVALLGCTVAVKVWLSPFFIVIFVLESAILLTSTFSTVTLQVVDIDGSLTDVAVMVTLPAFRALSIPVLSIVAMLVLLLFHVTFLFKAVLGNTVMVSLVSPPTFTVTFFSFITIELKFLISLSLFVYLK